MSDARLHLDRLTAGYRGVPVVREVTVEVGAGEVVALLGANGAGKTTTLRAISGLVPALAGSVTVDGHALDSLHAARRARLGIAHVPDDRGLFASLTVAQHLRLRHRRERMDEQIAYHYFPALAPLRNRPVGLLSGGEQQMAAVGRALARHPQVLLVDELSQGLAPIVVEQLLPAIRAFADESACAVLLVEQRTALVLDVADRGYVLSRGGIAAEETAATLRADPSLILDRYLGR